MDQDHHSPRTARHIRLPERVLRHISEPLRCANFLFSPLPFEYGDVHCTNANLDQLINYLDQILYAYAIASTISAHLRVNVFLCKPETLNGFCSCHNWLHNFLLVSSLDATALKHKTIRRRISL